MSRDELGLWCDWCGKAIVAGESVVRAVDDHFHEDCADVLRRRLARSLAGGLARRDRN